MKIAIIYHLDPSHEGKGGAVRYINNLIRYLLKENIDTTLIGAQITEQSFRHDKFNYIPVIRNSNVWWKYLIALFFKLPFLNLPKDMVIHIHRIEYALPFVIFCRDNLLIYTIHGTRLATAKNTYPSYAYKIVDKVYFFYERSIFSRIDKIIAVSKYVSDSFEKIHPDISNKIRVISVGVNLDEFMDGNKEKMRFKYGFSTYEVIILYAGLLEKRKNLNLLIKSFFIVSSKNKHAKLIIVGEGPEKKLLEDLVDTKGLAEKVVFFGEVKRNELISLFLCADMFVLTSFSEGSPNVIKEALASGIPVVSTNVGDAREVINSEYLGTIVEGYNEKKFADAMLKTIQFINGKEDLIKNECKNAAKKFSLGRTMRDIIQLYKV